MNNSRIDKLRKLFQSANIDSFLITKNSSLRYIYGFTGSNGLGLVTENKNYFITDFRYKDQAQLEVTSDEILLSDSSLLNSLSKLTGLADLNKVGFESDHIPHQGYLELQKSIIEEKLIPSPGLIETISAIKDEGEIDLIRKACGITVKIFNDIIPLFKEGVTEKEIAAEINYRIFKEGGDGEAFESIVLFGTKTAMPHGTPDINKLKKGDLIQLDFGVNYRGYRSDFSRVLVLGKPDRQQREIFLAVKEALDTSLKMLSPGIPGKDVDFAAREKLKSRGFDRYFGHSLGHGVGLDIHSLPRLSMKSTDSLQPGNVFTIEPGVYITGIGGVRIEDLILMTDTGVENLTDVPHDLVIC